LGGVLFEGSIFLLNFWFATTVFSSSDDFSGRRSSIAISIFGDCGLLHFIPVGFGRKPIAFGERWIVEEVGHLVTIPCLSFVMFLDFNLYVYLHKLIITA